MQLFSLLFWVLSGFFDILFTEKKYSKYIIEYSDTDDEFYALPFNQKILYTRIATIQDYIHHETAANNKLLKIRASGHQRSVYGDSRTYTKKNQELILVKTTIYLSGRLWINLPSRHTPELAD